MNFPTHKDTVSWGGARVIWSDAVTEFLRTCKNTLTLAAQVKTDKYDNAPNWQQVPYRAGWRR